MMRIGSPVRVLNVALALGWSTDLLFYGKSVGISVLLFVLLVVTTLLGLGRLEKVPLAWRNLWLLLPLLYFAVMAFVRANSTLTTLNVAAVAVLLGLLAFFYTAERVESLGVAGYPAVLAVTLVNMVVRPLPPVSAVARDAAAHKDRFRALLPLARGAMLAVPVLAVFAALLSSADTVFAGYMEDAFQFKYFVDAPEFALRAWTVLVASWLIAGGLLFTLNRKRDSSPDPASGRLPGVFTLSRGLGFVETATVLGLVNLLFVAFAWIQFTYLFFGEAYKTMYFEEYREYVRRGFGELLVAAVLTMALILGLRWIAWKETHRDERLLNLLCTLMIALTGVMLVSAFMRMMVWESVEFYINTPLRIYVRYFIIWLGLLFAWLLLTLWLRPQRFAIGGFIAAIGFLVTINAANPDADVAAYNLQRSDDLATRFVHLLSDDAVPVLVAGMSTAPDDTQWRLREHLAYRLKSMEADPHRTDWQSFHLSRRQAYDQLVDLRSAGRLVLPTSQHSPRGTARD